MTIFFACQRQQAMPSAGPRLPFDSYTKELKPQSLVDDDEEAILAALVLWLYFYRVRNTNPNPPGLYRLPGSWAFTGTPAPSRRSSLQTAECNSCRSIDRCFKALATTQLVVVVALWSVDRNQSSGQI